MTHANTVATWVSILSVMIGGSIWIGAVASDVENTKATTQEHKQQIDKLRNEGPPSIARLEEKTNAIQGDVEDIKRSQEEILKELRKK